MSAAARLAARLLALGLLAAGCAPQGRDTRFLNMDKESSPGALTAGWSGFEALPSGDTFVWARAREAQVTVVASDSVDRLVRFRVWPFRWDGAPPQTLTLSVNDVRLDPLTLSGDGPRVYATTAPGPAWKVGANVLTFAFAYAEAPKDRIPGASDPRPLAVAFDWVEVLPLAAEGQREP